MSQAHAASRTLVRDDEGEDGADHWVQLVQELDGHAGDCS